ncbi:hypothetical protein Cgig2_033385 [Carnegiea gigantea]|uniref:DUF7642 domain-containing protein n=1 Tax=Carnegiea gigantea TaxID=171969 RepID=A0A9Q1KSN6_9CARY|nr:hypothetical protein Cgig2_033385 [Carnegiea gigantea]
MFMSRTDGIPEASSSNDALLSSQASEADGDEETDSSARIVYMASFDELAEKYLQYDTIIWISISLLLVLAWGAGVIMLLYLPYKRYVLQKDISSRKLYITPAEIVYKVAFVEDFACIHIGGLLHLGCLESVFQLHTFRVESIPCGGAAAVDELQVQGVSSPGILRKAIISEASKVIQSSMTHISFLAERPFNSRAPSKSWKVANAPHTLAAECMGLASRDLLLHKLDDINESVKVQISSLFVPCFCLSQK